jgi:hypothetical protein
MDELLSEIQAAPILGLAVKTLQLWRQQSRGPRYVRLGRRVLYPQSELAAYVARNLVSTEESPEGDAGAEENGNSVTAERAGGAGDSGPAAANGKHGKRTVRGRSKPVT